MHKNRLNGKVYVGITNDTKRRWRQNGAEYTSGKNNTRFVSAVKRYGLDAFDHIILADGLSFDEACSLEVEYIKRLDATNPKIGYNMAPGGNGGRVYEEHPRNMLGKPQTEYQKAHQKAFMLNKDNNPMSNGAVVWGVTHPHPRGFKGKKKSPESRAKTSKTLREGKYCCKPVKAIFPDGTCREFESTKAAEAIGLTKPVILKLLRRKTPFEIKVINQYSEKNLHLVGVKFEYVKNAQEDTEATNETKESLEP